MLIAGIVCLLLAAGAAGYAWWMNRRYEQLAAVDTSTCGHMRQLADAANVSANPSVFRQRCELSGVAKAAYLGTVTAPETQRECVWYRTKVTHEYYDVQWHDNRRRRVKQSRTLRDVSSDAPFAIDDGTGQAVVYPDDADIDSPVEVLDEFEQDAGPGGLTEMFEDALQGVDDSIGFRREEWIIPLEQRLFVQGEVTDEEGKLRLRKPGNGPFRVSTRSEAELVKEAQTGRKWGSVGAGALAVVGLVLVVAGLVA
jgi:hypothetical protein